eukprot:603923-Rhodomonas_salina.1
MGLSLLSSLGMLMHALVTQSMQVRPIHDAIRPQHYWQQKSASPYAAVARDPVCSYSMVLWN